MTPIGEREETETSTPGECITDEMESGEEREAPPMKGTDGKMELEFSSSQGTSPKGECT